VGACPGTGRQNIKLCFDVCREKAQRDFNIILESWMEPCETIEMSMKQEDEWAREGVRFLKKIIG
jgi:hypothetical protein